MTGSWKHPPRPRNTFMDRHGKWIIAFSLGFFLAGTLGAMVLGKAIPQARYDAANFATYIDGEPQ